MISVAVREKSFGDGTPVLSDIHFSVGAGEFAALIGPSGAGKSTLLQIISGLERDFSGRIVLKDCEGRPARIGYMFQEPRLMPWLTALDNVCIVASDRQARQRAEVLLEAVGLAANTHSYPCQLSGGMQRRVALARAFMHQPDVLLMDEPFVSLDFPSAEELRQLLLALWREQQPAIIYVTHNLDEAIVMADRLLFLSTGPASVILDTPVDIERPRRDDMPELAAFKQQLLTAAPDLLAGSLKTT